MLSQGQIQLLQRKNQSQPRASPHQKTLNVKLVVNPGTVKNVEENFEMTQIKYLNVRCVASIFVLNVKTFPSQLMTSWDHLVTFIGTARSVIQKSHDALMWSRLSLNVSRNWNASLKRKCKLWSVRLTINQAKRK